MYETLPNLLLSNDTIHSCWAGTMLEENHVDTTTKERLLRPPVRASVSELYEQAYHRAHRVAVSDHGSLREEEPSRSSPITEPSADAPQKNARHPGRALQEDFLRPRNLTADRLCAATGIAPERLAALLAEAEPLCEGVAAALAAFFGGHASFWLDLQARYEQKK